MPDIGSRRKPAIVSGPSSRIVSSSWRNAGSASSQPRSMPWYGSSTWMTPVLCSFGHRRGSPVAWTALPVGLVLMLISLSVNVPRYFISHHHGQRELGVYSAIANLMVAGTMVMTALGQAASPRLASA